MRSPIVKTASPGLASRRPLAALSLLAFVAIWLTVQPVRAEGEFVADIPLMPQMALEQDLGFSFDSPSGRIIVLYARSPQSSQSVFDFYQQSLTALGWQGAAGQFTRGREKLEIQAANSSAGIIWKIALTPVQPQDGPAQ